MKKDTQEWYNKCLKEKGLTTMKEWACSEGKDIKGMKELLECLEYNDLACILVIEEFCKRLDEFVSVYPNGLEDLIVAVVNSHPDDIVAISDTLLINLVKAWRNAKMAIDMNGQTYAELIRAYNLRETPEKIVLKRNTKNVFIKCNI